MDGSPADGQPAAVQAAFVQLRARFVAGLGERWRVMDTSQGAPALAAALHQLAGAAGSYGLPSLGEAARTAERQVGSGTPAALAAALQAVKQQMAQAGAILS